MDGGSIEIHLDLDADFSPLKWQQGPEVGHLKTGMVEREPRRNHPGPWPSPSICICLLLDDLLTEVHVAGPRDLDVHPRSAQAVELVERPCQPV